MKRFFFTTLFLCSFLFSVHAQHFLSTSGKVIVNELQDTVLLRGMGLGGWMLQEGYMLQTAGFANSQRKIRAEIEALIGTEDTDLFYEAWYANHVRKSDIDSLKAWGFNSVRLPMHYNLFTLPIEDEPIPGQQTWLNKGFEMTDSLIQWCASNEMYVVLDLHAAPGGQGYDEGISDYDPSKPSLWESAANKEKTVALWHKLAERYADEQWVAGYDLLNEPNWDLPGGVALRNLYENITDAIRTVDPNHILFIEGNWFANDFTGLTPPWDDQLVYAPHKYWSVNDEASMQWVIDIRNNYNVPLYLGESGENSNVWFADAIRLLEDLGIGWAWWPMKKVESISCPLSINKSEDYQSLLDYWNGNENTPTATFAKNTLMQLTEDLKSENCRVQKDVIDAMFRQIDSEYTIPFSQNNIPGITYATDYDLGIIGQAYYDVQSANYNVTTGEYTSWNDGWAYRNDGVDIEFCSDNLNSNGFNVGFCDTDEWMQYEVEIAESGVYDIEVRTASGGSGGRFHFEMDGADLIEPAFAPPTSSWQQWTTVLIEDVILDETDSKLRFYIDQAGFNVSSFEFITTGLESSDIETVFVGAITLNEYSIQMNANKLIEGPLPVNIADFEIRVNEEAVEIESYQLDPENSRIIQFTLSSIINYSDEITISYNGSDILANDETALQMFDLEPVENKLQFVHQIPTRIQAESFVYQSGIALEQTTDVGGGQNVGYLDANDYMDYEIYVPAAGNYRLDIRHAAQYGSAQLKIVFIDQNESVFLIDQPSFFSTGGWQSWQTKSFDTVLPEGRYTMRVSVLQGPLNINWMEFDLPTSVANVVTMDNTVFSVYPNPSNGLFDLMIESPEEEALSLIIYNSLGRRIYSKEIASSKSYNETLSLEQHQDGVYIICLSDKNGAKLFKRIQKISK